MFKIQKMTYPSRHDSIKVILCFFLNVIFTNVYFREFFYKTKKIINIKNALSALYIHVPLLIYW
jgi:hypothetical protein